MSKPNSFSDHLDAILQVPLVDTSFLVMDVYKVTNFPILHSALQKPFCYSVYGEYMALLFNGIYVTIPLECDMLACVFTRGHTY